MAIMGCPDVILPNSPKDGFVYKEERQTRAEDAIFIVILDSLT